MTITDARSSIDELRMLKAAIFDDTSNGKLTKKDKTVFWYRKASHCVESSGSGDYVERVEVK